MLRAEGLLLRELAKEIETEGLYLSCYEAGRVKEIFFERGYELQQFILLKAEQVERLPDCWVLASQEEDSGFFAMFWGDFYESLSWVKSG